MSISPERREKMTKYLRGSSKFHGEFKYPEACYPFADLAVQETVEMPPEDGYGYKIYIFTAKNRTPNCPVHINIHGGGFVNPHQINDSLWSAWLADAIQGVVVDVDYTLSDEAPYPVCLDQCRAVGRYVYANCAKWDCDPKRISVGGYSAGGTLSVGVAMKAAQTGECPYCLVVNGYGPSDLSYEAKDVEAEDYWVTPEGRNAAFMELLTDGDPELSLDPYLCQDRAPDELLAGMPRTVICAGGLCPFRFQNEAFGQRLASLGVEVTMRRFLGAVHGFIPHFMDHWEEGAELIVRAIRSASL